MTRSGGQAAADDFDDFVAARSMALRRLAVLMTGDDGHAEDAVQTALLAVWRRWERVSRLDNVEAYVRTTLVNTIRSDRRRRRPELLRAEAPERHGDDVTDAVVDRDPLWRAIRRLPDRQRAVLVLRFYEDLTEAQTAITMGCHVGTVKKYTARALTTLRADPRIGSGTEVAR